MVLAKLKTSVAFGVAVLLAAGPTAVAVQEVLAQDSPNQAQKLADGSVLTAEAMKIGPVYEVLRGNPLKLEEFTNSLGAALSVRFKLSGATSQNPLVNEAFSRQFGTVVLGDDGIEYMNELLPFQKFENDYYGHLDTTLFPRDSRRLRLRIQQRGTEKGPWITVAEFTCNQTPGKEETWVPEQPPASHTAGDMQVFLGEVTVQVGTYSDRDPIWNRTVLIPWRMMQNGLVLSNWDLENAVIRDSSGNADYFGTAKSMSNGWIYSTTWRSPDPRKVWRIQGQLAQSAGFAESNVFTVHIPASRARRIMEESSFETNLGGYPFRFSLRNGADFISTEFLLTNRTDLRLSLLKVEDQTGADINGGSGSWGQFSFYRSINMPPPPGDVVVTFAIGRNIPVEFTVKPRLVIPAAGNDGE